MADRPTYTHRRERHGVVGPFTGRQLALAAGSVVIAALVLVAVTTPLGNTNGGSLPDPRSTAQVFRTPPPGTGLGIGSVAPDFTVQLPDGTTYQLTDLDGKPIRLADLRGKAVWVNFWASWCGPCQQETPILREVSDEYRSRGLVLVAVEAQETVDTGRRYAERYGLNYTIGADVSGHIFGAYRVYALPTQFFIGPDGIVKSVVQGPLSKEGAEARVQSILPPGTSGSPSASPSPSPS
ncbi:MAG: TlpA family protein disulfide reductase [Chloroflexota bacterium]